MNYEECREVIAMYSGELLEFFSDRWERLPTGNNKDYVLKVLLEKQVYFEEHNMDVADKLNKVVCELLKS